MIAGEPRRQRWSRIASWPASADSAAPSHRAGADGDPEASLWLRERTVRLAIAALAPVFGLLGLVSLFSADGPAPGAPRVIACVVLATTIPAAILVSRFDLRLLWLGNHSRLVAPNHVFVVYGDIGVTAVIATFSSRQAALFGTMLFALLSVYAAHFARPVARNLHMVFTTVVIVVFGVLLMRSGEVDAGGAITRMLVGVVVVNGTVVQQSMYTLDVRRDVGVAARRAHQDALTLLWNRHGFADGGCEVVLNCRHHFGVLFVDIDNFKQINDTHGHHAGDDVLCLAAQRLTVAVDDSGVLGRVGGDEFAFAADASVEELTRLAQKIRDAVHQPTDQFPVTVTVGVAGRVMDDADRPRPRDLDEAQALLTDTLQSADAALYRGKQAGRNRVVVADPSC